MAETLTINLSEITVLEGRQRKDLGDLPSLAQSIAANGLLQPVIVRRTDPGKYELVAGERRFRAHELLGKRVIEARIYSSLSLRERQIFEFEENVKRKQLEWPEYVAAVHGYVKLTKNPSSVVALELGISEASVSILCAVHEAVRKEPALLEQRGYSAVYNILKARAARAMDSLNEEMLNEPAVEPFQPPQAQPFEPAPVVADAGREVGEPKAGGATSSLKVTPPATPIAAPKPLPDSYFYKGFRTEKADFRHWAPRYTGQRFNFIHCDFPYGLNMDSANLQNSASKWVATGDGRYDDSPALYLELLETFFQHQSRFIADNAHCIFWCAGKSEAAAKARFRHAGWDVYDNNLIWHKSDNAGIASNVRKFPRHTYEVAIFAVRGNRQLAKLKADSYSGPTTKEHHLSEKPLEMLRHFFSLTVDNTTTMLDPTCGGGTALQVAIEYGASAALGLDVDASHVLKTYQRIKSSADAQEALSSVSTIGV